MNESKFTEELEKADLQEMRDGYLTSKESEFGNIEKKVIP